MYIIWKLPLIFAETCGSKCLGYLMIKNFYKQSIKLNFKQTDFQYNNIAVKLGLFNNYSM